MEMELIKLSVGKTDKESRKKEAKRERKERRKRTKEEGERKKRRKGGTKKGRKREDERKEAPIQSSQSVSTQMLWNWILKWGQG